jgi:hypothetical protein
MPLTDAQKAEADSFGISYDLYEKLQTATFDEKALAAAVASFTAPGGIGTPEGQAASIAGIAESMARNTGLPGGIPLQIQAAQLGDTVMPSYTIIKYDDKPDVIIDSKNPFNLPTTTEGLNNLLKGATSITDDRVGDIPVPVIVDTPLNIPQNTIYTIFVNLSGPNYSAAFTSNGQTTKLKQGLTEIKINIGSNITFISANASLYNLIGIDIDSGKTKKNLKSSKDTPSLTTELNIDGTYNVDLYTETNLIKQTVSAQFSIELSNKEDSAKRYNINSNVGLPIGLIKSGKVEQVTAYINKKTYRFDVNKSNVITIPDSAFDRIGNYKTILVPYNSTVGDGTPLEFAISAVEEMFVGTPDIRNIKYPKLIKGADYIGADVYFKISYDSVNTDFVKIKKLGGASSITATKSGFVDLNFKQLYELDNTIVSENDDKISLSLVLTPYNISGFKQLAGKDEIITINLDKGDLTIPREVAINRIAEGFLSQLDTSIFKDETSKYLTHLLHLGNGNNKVITTWTGSAGSLIAKLYEPLPTTIQTNQQVWISKLQSNPIVETVTLSEQTNNICPPLKGPNFSLEPDNGIGYKVFDEVIASGSQTSNDLVTKYLESTGIDTSKLNITYASGSDYLFTNFVNFSSAEERVNNFFYKVQLIEDYKTKYTALIADTFTQPYVELTSSLLAEYPNNIGDPSFLIYDGATLITEDFIFDEINWEINQPKGTAQISEAKKILDSANALIRGFDGFEKWLYSDTEYLNTLSYPKTTYTNPINGLTIYILKPIDDSDVVNWYDSIIQLSAEFDKYNPNYLVNNIPTFIQEDYDNNDFIVFLDMIGQHFDIIWAYINGLKKVHLIEEKQSTGAIDKLIYYLLESMGWDSKIAFDSNSLWEYAFGTNKEGFQKYSMPLEEANNQIWRRILNNLPYLLKHKGTSRAMKAVMACYGVPQSMLTIMEFGGPQDPTKEGSTKFTFDDRTAAIKLQNNSSIIVPWKSVNGSYPQSIEFRIKPNSVKNTRIISSSQFYLDIEQTTGSFATLTFGLGENAISAGPYFENITSSNFNWTNTFWAPPSSSIEYYTGSIGAYISAVTGSPFYYTPSATMTVEYYNGANGEYALGPDTVSGSSNFPLSTEYYSNVLINRYPLGGAASVASRYEVLLKTSDGQRIINSVSMSFVSTKECWESGSYVSIGNDFSGSLDEFRLWRVPLQPSKFENHTLHPDAINGNSYTASTADMLFRLDFEYPKNRILDPYIKNVSLSTQYSENSATASNMFVAPNYPYQYDPYDRTVTATVPSLGLNYSNKIRFESASLVGDLSYKARATKKSFDQSTIDSNRLGIFMSPIKELNMDIVKAFGDFNIDNYIGDPSDDYKDSYRELADLRKYYFQRLNRNMNEYIQLVRYIDKSLFDVLSDLAPARTNVSKGLLIEPHYLERSKVRWDKPKSERGDYESVVNAQQYNEIEVSYESKDALIDATQIATLVSDLPSYDALVNTDEVYLIESENNGYETEISTNDVYVIETEYPTYPPTGSVEIYIPTGATITAEIDSFNTTIVGMNPDSLANAGFGLYGENGTGIVRSYDPLFGNYQLTGNRKNIFLIKQQYTQKINTQTEGYPTTPYGQVKYEKTAVTKYRYKVGILPFSTGSYGVPFFPSASGDLVEITPLNGYFPSHYKFVNNLSEGMQRSYFKGSLQTSGSTPDGLAVVETFTTNPNILRVAKTGRGSGEPILIVE